jgi:lipoprotein-anchoring transpeptidase ErfK/SrfK
MTRTGTSVVARKPGPMKLAVAGIALLTTVALAGCGEIAQGNNGRPGAGTAPTGPASGAPSASDSPSPSPSPTPDPLSVKANIRDGADQVRVNKRLSLTAQNGTLEKVRVTAEIIDHGETEKIKLGGELSKDKTSWTADELLEPRGDYKIKVAGRTDEGVRDRYSSTFHTEDLDLKTEEVYPSFSGTLGGTVGVATPVVLRFDYPVEKKRLFQKNMKVSNTSGQVGSWHWYNDQEVHWRPKNYWKPGTRVTASANVNSLAAGDGRYGQMDTSTSFTVGRSVITKVNLKSDQAKVFINGKMARKIPVSGGKPGWTTRSGVKVVTAKHTDYKFTDEQIDAPEQYDLTSKYAMRITNSGEFIHSAPWNAAYFGKKNASHGCIGMSNQNTGWLYQRMLVGSPVVVTGTDRGLEPLNGLTDWDMSFSEYKQGSAL